jgi:hypothetical protein
VRIRQLENLVWFNHFNMEVFMLRRAVMSDKYTTPGLVLPLLFLVILLSACSTSQTALPGKTPQDTDLLASPTSTATAQSAMGESSKTAPPADRCVGLSGEIEVRLLVGPSEAVGLEPHAVGSVPFSVETAEPPYLIKGAGSINYADILVEQWGTYEVTMDMLLDVEGECVSEGGSTELQMALGMSGQQMVEVNAGGFQGEYPWDGSHQLDLVFPAEEGAVIDGEGYSFVLHLENR